MGKVLDEMAVDHADSVHFTKLNVDDSPRVAAAYGIDSIPTLLLFNDGEIVGRLIGLQPKAELQRLLEQAAA
jgi:thioredoxin 1